MRYLLLLSAIISCGGGVLAGENDVYIAEVSPTRIEVEEGGKFTYIYDLSQYKKPGWLPNWAKEESGADWCGGSPSPDELRSYLDSIPAEVRIAADMSQASFYVDCPYDYEESTKLESSFAPFVQSGALPSVDMLLWRGKFSDDGLIAAIEYYDEYARPGLNRSAMFDRLCQLVAKYIATPGTKGEGARALLVTLWTARVMSGDKLPQALKQNADFNRDLEKSLKAVKPDEATWKPLSFYTWMPQLARIYTRNRILGKPVVGDNAAAALIFLSLMDEDEELAAAYKAEISRRTILAGEPDKDVLAILGAVCGTHTPDEVLADEKLTKEVTEQAIQQLGTDEGIVFTIIPGASSPETRYMATLMSEQLADFMTYFVEAIRDGTVSLDPGENGPLYLFQQHALEPLLKYDKQPEAVKLEAGVLYAERLQEAFEALYAAHRETFAGLMAMGGTGCAEPGVSYHNQIMLHIYPNNRLEPLPEVYRRTAIAYQRLAEILKTDYAGGNQMVGLRQQGNKTKQDAAAEVEYLSQLYQGFYLLACDDLGMMPQSNSVDHAQARQIARRFLDDALADTELKRDVRFILPVGNNNDPTALETYYWAITGIREKRICINFRQEPTFEFTNANDDDFTLSIDERIYRIAAARFLEVELPGSKSLNRQEFQTLVNRAGRDQEKVEKALESWAAKK